MSDTRRVEVGVEVGPKRRVFAQAIGWPGWCRGGRREEDALEALAGHAGRYRAAMGPLASSLPSAPQLVVVERVDGDATTEFGAPGRAFLLDRRVLEPGEPDRLAEMLRVAWAALDSALAVNPEASRDVKPPVGRSPTGIWLHAGGAERAYLSPML